MPLDESAEIGGTFNNFIDTDHFSNPETDTVAVDLAKLLQILGIKKSPSRLMIDPHSKITIHN